MGLRIAKLFCSPCNVEIDSPDSLAPSKGMGSNTLDLKGSLML